MISYRPIVMVTAGLFWGCSDVENNEKSNVTANETTIKRVKTTSPNRTSKPLQNQQTEKITPLKKTKTSKKTIISFVGFSIDAPRCIEMLPSSCPPKTPSNPPPPNDVECPSFTITQIVHTKKGCLATGKLACPPDKDCTPISRTKIDCPEGLEEGEKMVVNSSFGCTITGKERWKSDTICPEEFKNKPNPKAHYFKDATGNCFAEAGDFDCPPDATCNPPPPERIPCPPAEFLQK